MNKPGVAKSTAVAGRRRNSNNAPHVPYKPSQKYKNQSMYLLKKEFPFLSVQAMSQIFQERQYDFTSSFEALQTIRLLLEKKGGLEIAHRHHPCLRRINKITILKARQKMKHTRITDEALLEELDQIPELNRKENVAPVGTRKSKKLLSLTMTKTRTKTRKNHRNLNVPVASLNVPLKIWYNVRRRISFAWTVYRK